MEFTETNLSVLEEKIGYTFKDKSLLMKAFTHSSYACESNNKSSSNERLEFLGDSVVKFILSENLYHNYPSLTEGMLSKIRSRVEDREALAGFARELDLGKYMLLSNGEEKQNGRNKAKILEDAFEALMGAVFLDAGIEKVKTFLLPIIDKKIKSVVESGNIEDYKTKLQQIIQHVKGEELKYEIIKVEGPDNAPTYTVSVLINSTSFGTGKGQSKKEAEQNAAKMALGYFEPEKTTSKEE